MRKRDNKLTFWDKVQIVFCFLCVVALIGVFVWIHKETNQSTGTYSNDPVVVYNVGEEFITQLPGEDMTHKPDMIYAEPDWDAIIAATETADLSGIKWGLGLIGTIVIPLEIWNLKTTSSNKTAIAVLKDREDRNKEV